MTAEKRVISAEAVKEGVEANGRLNALTGAVLLVLLAAMGLTVLDVVLSTAVLFADQEVLGQKAPDGWAFTS
jgi:hypothetical protein